MKENKSFDGTLLMSPNRLGSIEIYYVVNHQQAVAFAHRQSVCTYTYHA